MSKTIFDSESNPVFSFLSSRENQPTSSDIEERSENTNIGDKKVVKKKKLTGSKTRRLNLLIHPQIHETLTKIACMKQTSVNAVIIQAAKEFCAKEARTLEKYELTFGAEAEEV